jgi:hypothetical protein
MPNTYGSDYGAREKALAKAIVDEMVRQGVGGGGGGGGGGGDASAANQLEEILRLGAIRDRLPPALDGGNLKVTLPAAADSATATNQATQITALSNILAAVDTVEPIGATQVARLEEIRDRLPPALDVNGGIKVYTGGNAATASNQVGHNNRLDSIIDRLPAALDVDGGLLTHVTNFESAVVNETALTAIGSTQARSGAGYKLFTYQAVVTNIGTNIVVRVEGNLGVGAWANLNVNNVDTTITANGTYIFTFQGKLVNIRFTLVSISGGTPSVLASLLMGN